MHFTLIALCLGLIVLAFFPSKSEIKTARDQATEIFEVANKWETDLFETTAKEFVKTEQAHATQDKITRLSLMNIVALDGPVSVSLAPGEAAKAKGTRRIETMQV